MKKIAIVILNWNGADMMRKFLPSVLCNSGDEAEVYVADNGSTDTSCDMLREEFPSVRLIQLDKNYGFAGGYNKALGLLEEPYFVLLNSDVEVTEGWLSPLLEYMEMHPDTAACQPKIRSWHHREWFEYAGASGGYMDALGYPYCRGRVFTTLEKDDGQYDSVVSLFWATGAALMIRREDWTAVGGLDARFFSHMEEIDLCWRLRARGRKIVCIPKSMVFHIGGATLKKENPRKTYLNFRNNLLMLYKNLPQKRLHRVMELRTLLDGIAAFKFFVSGDVANAKAVFRARTDYYRMKSDFKEDRIKNLEATVDFEIPEQFPKCLLWQYYVSGKKKFSSLMETKRKEN